MAQVTFSINAVDKTRAVFASVDARVKRLSKSTNSLQNQVLGAGLGVLGAGSLFVLLGNQVRDLIRDIDDIPGIPEDTRQSVRDLRDTFVEAKTAIAQFTAPLIGGLTQGMKSVGLFAGAISTLDFKDLLLPGAAYAKVLGTIDDALADQAAETNRLMQEQNKQALAALDNAKKEKQAIDEIAKAKRAIDERNRLAETITNRNLNPTEKFNKEVGLLKSVKDLLSPDTFMREFERLKNTLLSPAGTGVGTREKPLTDQFTRIGLISDRRENVATAMQSEAKKQTDLLQNIRDLLQRQNTGARREVQGGSFVLT
jgi:hypothetical protein